MQERRTELRMLCADLVEVCWEDEHHRPRETKALLEDISRAGACLEFEMPVPVGTRVHLFCGKEALEGKVRYCVYRDIGYLVGIQFDTGSEWSRRNFEPEHLLDLAKLVRGRRHAS
jgi:PilZ domain